MMTIPNSTGNDDGDTHGEGEWLSPDNVLPYDPNVGLMFKANEYRFETPGDSNVLKA